MNKPSHNFLLAGNGSFANRGCEAIVVGTLSILRKRFANMRYNVASYYDHWQPTDRIDADDVEFVRLGKQAPFTKQAFLKRMDKRMGRPDWRNHDFDPLKPLVPGCLAALSIGGDNYGLDYGRPTLVMNEDAYIMSKGKPLIIWGASIGRFDADPEAMRTVIPHLKRATAIFARETVTLEYLAENGITENTRLVADPAFVLPASPPPQEIVDAIPVGAVGINSSELIGRSYYPEGMDVWIDKWAKAITAIHNRFGRPVLLTPHVIPQDSAVPRSDYHVLSAVLDRSGLSRDEAFLLPPTLNASQIKWAISQCEVFAGARTHSTVAALSSLVPTISIGYSVKAIGINRDIYGHENFCLHYNDFSPDALVELIEQLLDNSQEIRDHLRKTIPGIVERAWSSGDYLAEVLADFYGVDFSEPEHVDPLPTTPTLADHAEEAGHLPLVSVIVPAYNAQGHIAAALNSLRRQTHRNLEVLVVNDGSTDETDEAVRPFLEDQRFKYFEQSNRGAAAARNRALAEATGDYVCLLDSDDVYAPTKIAEQVLLAEESKADFVYCNRWEETKDGDVRLQLEEWPWKGRRVREAMADGNPFATLSVMVTRELALSVGGFDETLKTSEDNDYWLKIVSAARRTAGTLKPLALVRYRSDSLSHCAKPLSRLVDLHTVLKCAADRETDPGIRAGFRRRARRAERSVWIWRAKEVMDERPYLASFYLLRSWLCCPKRSRALFLSVLLAIPLPQARVSAGKIVERHWPA